MDYLRSLHVEDLPEQQTRMMHLLEDPSFLSQDRHLGWDACASCGQELSKASDVRCRQCRRVSYCSEACRQTDASHQPHPDDEERGLGHTSVICALLQLCQEDFNVETGEALEDPSRQQAAQDRIESELESYPATLANVIRTGPSYEQRLKDCQSRQRLVIHVIGASVDSELWNVAEDLGPVWRAYAEALSELAEAFQLDVIEVVFCGPDCPTTNISHTQPMQSAKRDVPIGNLVIQSCRGDYTTELLQQGTLTAPDIVVFFNPGFTVPEYDWVPAISCIPAGTPFLSTTNTELEGMADCQFLLDQDKIQNVPPAVAIMLGLYSEPDEEETPLGSAFFSDNPFCGNRVRQSGTMANDVYVKNRWILGGIMGSFDPSQDPKSSAHQQSTKRLRKDSSNPNHKSGNPALI